MDAEGGGATKHNDKSRGKGAISRGFGAISKLFSRPRA
jgi:hypothetical protein